MDFTIRLKGFLFSNNCFFLDAVDHWGMGVYFGIGDQSPQVPVPGPGEAKAHESWHRAVGVCTNVSRAAVDCED